MRLGALLIGTELLQGKITDANTVWLGQFLRSWDLTLTAALTIRDDESAILAGLEYLYTRCDVVICSGGLGPTRDDITKHSLGLFFGKKLQPSSEAQQVVSDNYHRLNLTFSPGHEYGVIPQDFKPLANPTGLAPGLWHHEGPRSLLALPGVPKEFQEMLRAHFSTLLLPLISQRPKLQLLNFRTRGVPEERIFNDLCPKLWEQLSFFGSVSSLPHILGVDLGVALSDASAEVIEEIRGIINNGPLAGHVWHEGHESLESVILATAQPLGIKFGFAESCTGGLCAHRFTNLPGASQVFWGSIVSYDNSVKEQVLGVNPLTLEQHGAVSAATVQEMAEGARRLMGVDLVIATSGIAGPQGGSLAKPVGTLWVGVSTAQATRSYQFNYRGDRETLKLRFSQIALFTLLDEVRLLATNIHL